MLQRSSGGSYPAITQSELKKIRIPLPNKEIQDKISKEIKLRISKADKLLKESEEILKISKIEVEKILFEE